ncbi:MAG: hypothetical protein PHF65_05765 [Oscillospiraceae bacterium]|nr:hypothetical protein [Oscillospiraceae bacterium]
MNRPSMLVMIRFVLLTTLVVGVLLSCACSVRSVRRAPTDTSVTTLSKNEDTVEVTVAQGPTGESKHTNTPTPTPTLTPTPTEATNPFTFDLTEDEVTDAVNPLMLIGGIDKAVIIGGQTSPLTEKGSFSSGLEIGDWDETAYYNGSSDCQYSIDRSKLVFTPRDKEGNDLLMYYDGTKARVITSDFYDFSFSLTGNAVAYTATSNGTDDLYIYDCEKKESRWICKDFEYKYGDLCISPSGDAVLYGDYNDPLYMIIGDNAPKKISSSGTPLAISDGGELVYYEETNGEKWELFVYKDGKSIQILAATAYGDRKYVNRNFIFNRDLTQILIALETRLWFSMDGSEAVSVANTKDSGTIRSSEYQTEYDFTCRSTKPFIRDGRTIYLPARNLCDQLYRFAGTLLYLDSNLDERYIAAQIPGHSCESSVCGDQIVYMEQSPNYDGADLYFTENYRKTGTAEKIPVEYAVDAVLTKNGSIYVENDIGQLFVVNGDDAPQLIATYADLIGRYEVDGTTYVFFTQDPGSRTWEYDDIDLYRVEDVSGAEPQKVASGIYGAHIDVTGIYTYEHSTHASEGESWFEDFRYSEDGKHFVFLCTKEFGP